MERAEKPFVFASKARRNRTVRIVKINRVIVLILLATMAICGVIVYFATKDNKALNIDKRTFYFVQMGEFTQSSDALYKSLEVSSGGGSGYIVNDGKFRVMAAVFDTKPDAESVKNKLIAAGKDCTIFELSTNKLALRKYDTKNETQIIRELVSYPAVRFFSQLQSLDQSLDRGETTDSTALLSLSALKKELNQNYEEIVSFLSKYPADPYLNALESIYSKISATVKSYLPDTELTIGTSFKTILCASAEQYVQSLNDVK